MKRFSIGIDWGATFIKIGLVKEKKIIYKKTLATKGFSNKFDLLNNLVANIKNLLSHKQLDKKDLLGIGVGVPGPVNSKKGVVYFFPNLPGWCNVPLKRILERKTALKVAVDNDANLFALAESRLGAGKGADNILALTLGTGVGAGLIIQGSLYRGSSLLAGELGHICIDRYGPLCSCGSRGCLERYVGNEAILKKAKRLFRRKISLEELSNLARKGNRLAIIIWKEVGSYIGLVLSGIINLLNPERIIIGGGVSFAGGVLFTQIRQTIKKYGMKNSVNSVKVLKAKLGRDAGILGAAILLREGV